MMYLKGNICLIAFFYSVFPIVYVGAEPSARVEEGKNITLLCRYESNIKENVLRWKRNKSIDLKAQNRYLTLTNVSRDSTGNYSCEVENRIGIGADMVEVIVLCKLLPCLIVDLMMTKAFKI